MFKNYLTVALRNLFRHKVYSAINILGMAIGMACCILMVLFIRDELSYDRFHERADRIYQVGKKSTSAWGPALKADFSEVLESVRFEAITFAKPLVSYGDKRFYEGGTALADASIFEVFSFPLVKGDPKTVFQDPFSIVITEEVARKYFGDQDPMGETLSVYALQKLSFKVSGVMQDIPRNSHLQFDFLIPFTTLFRTEDWTNTRHTTFVLLHEKADAGDLQARLPAFFNNHGRDRKHERLTPLTRLHIQANAMNKIGEYAYLYLLGAIAALVLFLACVNFTNLATARSFTRIREVGMRKVIGARRSQVIRQFLGESVLLSLLSLLLAVVLVEIALPTFNTFADKNLSMPYFDDGWTVLYGVVLAVAVGVLAGSYPALFLSAFRPISVFRGLSGRGPGRALFRRALMVVQFAGGILLIVVTGLVYQQSLYMKATNLGFDKEHVIVLPIFMSQQLVQKSDVMKQALLKSPQVLNAAASHRVPGEMVNTESFVPKRDPDGEKVVIAEVAVDRDYLSLYGIDLVAGRPFSEAMKVGVSDACIVNEEAVRRMQLSSPEEAIGMRSEFKIYGQRKTIIGVMKDYHFQSLRKEIQPLAIHLVPNFSVLSVRIRSDHLTRTMDFVEKTWAQFAPEFPFEYRFLDESMDRLYRSEVWWGQVLGVFSGLAILIACMGLLGLVALTVEQRTKEIGIRKALGIALAELLLPTFNALAGQNLALGWDTYWSALPFLTGLLMVVGLAGGGYPSVVLSRFDPVVVLKNQIRPGGRSILRRGLVTVQFGLSVFLIVCTFVMADQLDYLQNKHLGFDGEQVVVIPTNLSGRRSEALLGRFRQALATHPDVLSVTGSSGTPGRGYSRIQRQDGPVIYIYQVDENYAHTLGLELVKGESFTQDRASQKNQVLVNEALVRTYGWADPVGEKVDLKRGNVVDPTVLGVVKDYHFLALNEEIPPVALTLGEPFNARFISVRLRPDHLPEAIDGLKTAWQSVASDLPFEFRFLDEDMDRLYRAEERWAKIVGYASILAVVIACLGLFGLTMLTVVWRTKEIGIRKVLGASTVGVAFLVIQEFLWLVAAANLVAWPASYWAMNRWLEHYPYRIEIGADLFILSGVLSVCIALLTVGYQAIRAATANPVEALRYE